MSSNPFQISDFERNQRLSAEDMNALLRSTQQRNKGGRLSRNSVETTASTDNRIPVTEPVRCWLDDLYLTLEQFSVFQVSYDPDSKLNTEYRLDPATIAYPDDPFGIQFYTNGQYEVGSGQSFWAWPINDGQVIKLAYEGQTPKVGHPIGANLNRKAQYGLPGFVCVMQPDTTQLYVWVRKAHSFSVYGEVESDIPSGSTGNLQIQDNAGVDQKDPDTDTTPFNWPIRNLGSNTLSAQTKVVANPIMGIGYVPVAASGPGISIEVGRVVADVASGSTEDVEQTDETGADVGNTITGVLNQTGVQLLANTIVWVTKPDQWSVKSMFPYKLEQCQLTQTIVTPTP